MSAVPHPPASRFGDPRYYQIAVLTGLLTYGTFVLEFDVRPWQIPLTLAVALVTQWACSRLWKLPAFDPRSALISALSLCLLLRVDSLWVVAAAAFVAIASKFVIQVGRKHIFNPTNGAIVLMLLITPAAWLSPAQWGSVAFFAFLMACLGGLVAYRALRSDVALAFIVVYAALMFGRSYYLGEPMTIPMRRLESGGLLLFTFFMISDPRTTPDHPIARLLFGALVAYVAWYIQFRLFRTNGVIWSLALCAPLVPVLDRVLPGRRFSWTDAAVLPLLRRPQSPAIAFGKDPRVMKRRLSLLFGLVALVAAAPAPADAFCGFFVSKADTKIFNKASKVVIARDGDRTVMTMSNDFKGEPKEFAVVVPVPTFLQKGQIHVGEQSLIDHLDAFTAPRLVEYFDDNPCDRRRYMMMERSAGMAATRPPAPAQDSAKRLGVTIEATYTVGEYDILILSAKESGGLATWLTQNGYKMPQGAAPVLASYLAQNMRFFVAKVNLGEQAKLGFNYLRPLQIAYESPKFMLPIRLGTLNAEGTQELFVFTLTNKGRVETTNYRTVRLPSDVEIPTYVKGDFGRFYKSMFSTQVKKQNMSTVFLEYAWDMGWCDPCAADPLSNDQLRKLGVFWLDGEPLPTPTGTVRRPRPMPLPAPLGGSNVFVTRLHVRYDGAHFPEDLVFQETGDRSNFQGRYILRHAWTGTETCSEADAYRRDLSTRREKEAQTLALLTGWDINEIRRKQGPGPRVAVDDRTWWQRLWP